MKPPHPPRPARLLSLAICVAAAVVLTPAVGSADTADVPDQPVAEHPDPFNGAFLEWSARAGANVPSSAQPGWIADVGFRNSLPMYVGDNRLAYSFGQSALDDRTVGIHGLHATLGLHPFYLALLSEGLFSHFLASLHLELGVGAQFAHLSAGDDADADGQFGVTGSVGAGFDLPLTHPNRGQSLWINTVYRRKWSSVGFEIDGQTRRLHSHQFFIGLAWRTNGTLW